MEVSNEAIRKNFLSKTDTELLDLVSSGPETTSEARFLLVQELQRRLAGAKQAAETVPLRHGWYTIVAPTVGIRFPELCPRCSRIADSNSLPFKSLENRRFGLFFGGTTRAVSNVPHCSNCAAELKRSRTICSSTRALVGFLWIAAVVWLRIPRFVSYVGIPTISAPFVYLYDRTSAVKLGDFSEGFVEYRFRSHEYAKAFALLNNVQAENAETLQSELEEAISRIRG
jgi:hypothetical protein